MKITIIWDFTVFINAQKVRIKYLILDDATCNTRVPTECTQHILPLNGVAESLYLYIYMVYISGT